MLGTAFVPNVDDSERVVIVSCNMVHGPPEGMRAVLVLVLVNGHNGGLDNRYLRAVIGREVVNH